MTAIHEDYEGGHLLIWVFVPYSIRNGRLDGLDFESVQSKYELARAFRTLNLAWIWQPIVHSNLDAIVQQVTESRRHEEAVVLNLCDGLEGEGTPGPSVLHALEQAGIPFTGSNSEFFEISTSKLRMKKMLNEASVQTPAFEPLPTTGLVHGVCDRVGVPVLVKPDVSAASGGIFLRSKVSRDEDVAALRDELVGAAVPVFCHPGVVFVERFIQGAEFTALVMGDWRDPESIRCLPPVERVFNTSIPDEERFLSYERYWGLHNEETPPPDGLPFYAYRACDPGVGKTIEQIARRAYAAVRGCGYARVDFRMDRGSGELFVLEVNANCGLSEDDQTSTGCILKLARMTLADLLGLIILDAAQPCRAKGVAV
jgi:D-alanine-D-alanine ligase